MSASVPCPRSATHGLVATAGLAAFLIAIGVVRLAPLFSQNIIATALFVMGATASVIFLFDLGWQKVYQRASTGLDFARNNASWSRTFIKFLGLLSSLGFVAFLYWLLPEYRGSFYDRYYAMLRIIVPPWLLLALPYLYWVDRHMTQPQDSYWQMGKLVSFQWHAVDLRVVGQHLLGWLVKGFFLPLMFTYLCNDLAKFLAFDFSSLTGFKFWFDFLYDFLFFVDVGLASMGYLMSLRLTDTHLRSSEPTVLGWVVALACYQPLWSLLGRQYFAYDTAYPWGAWLWNTPVAYSLWGACILGLIAIYVWATVSFGARFSNLTHRGIITNGPYRWTKHPAYIAKNLSYWMMAVPFMAQGSADETLRHCLLLLGVNGIYVLRAKTEEWHLSRDPDYVAYALWIKEHGLFRWIQRVPLINLLTYRAPAST